ncbi:unnamed protein product, partial [Bubo scandiacus]
MSTTRQLQKFGVVPLMEIGTNILSVADEGWTYLLTHSPSFRSLSESLSPAHVTGHKNGRHQIPTHQFNMSNPKLEWKSDITNPDPVEVKGSFVIDFNETRIHPRKEHVPIPLASLLHLKLVMHLMYLTCCSAVLLGLTVYQETSEKFY